MIPSHPTLDRTPTLARLLAFGLLLVLGLGSTAWSASKPNEHKEPKEWERLDDCTYVPNANNDGDSFEVRAGKKRLHVRLYFVDTPETSLAYPSQVVEQASHFGISAEEVVRMGAKAATVVRELLKGKTFTVETRRTVAGGRSRLQRYFAFVEIGSESLAEMLVSQGWARPRGTRAPSPSGEPSKSIQQRLENLEAEARRRKVGIWAFAGATSASRGK